MNSLKDNYKDILFALVLAILMFLTYDPLGVAMPEMMAMSALGLSSVALVVFLVFIWKSKPADERETAHLFFSSRIAFTVGILILSIANILQVLQHDVDPWIPLTLISMVLAQVISNIVAKERL